MRFFRKDGSLDTTLAGMFYPPIDKVDKMCKIILSYGGQYHKKGDGGVKFYLLEEGEVKDERGLGRLFTIPENVLIFDEKPKVFVEGVEHSDFCNGRKEMIHIFADRMGNPFMPFFIPHEQKMEEGHAFFSFKDGYEIIVFWEEGQVRIQFVNIKSRLLKPDKHVIYENPVYEGLLSQGLPRKFWNLNRAFIAAKEKFFGTNYDFPYFFKAHCARQ